MAKTAILVGIGVVIAVIIGGIFVVLTYSDGTEITSEPEIDTEAEEPGEVLKLRLGESVSMGESP